MKYNITVPKVNEYHIVLEPGCMEQAGSILKAYNFDGLVTYVADQTVAELYGKKLENALTNAGIQVDALVIDCGENTKSFPGLISIIEQLIRRGVHRRSILIALGGGVITDLVGFVASIYMRGISYISIPTTLLAQLDAAIGGKTAINLSSAKNIVGAFHFPSLVLIDPGLLETLPVAEIRHGLAEAIKVAVIGSSDLLGYIESHLGEILQKQISSLEYIIGKSIQLKLDLLEPDPYERILERLLNFGHTFGHALETAMGYNGIHHGDAISIGMMAESWLAYKRRICERELVWRLENLLLSAGLPVSCSADILPRVYKSLREIALVRGNMLNVVLPVSIGKAIVDPTIQADELLACIPLS